MAAFPGAAFVISFLYIAVRPYNYTPNVKQIEVTSASIYEFNHLNHNELKFLFHPSSHDSSLLLRLRSSISTERLFATLDEIFVLRYTFLNIFSRR